MTKLFKYLIVLSVLMSSAQCSSIKPHPEYTGVDPRAASIVDEYLWLSAQKHIQFTNQVTVGFKKIKDPRDPLIVGLCTYGSGWREIDVDLRYWNESNKRTKIALLFHELSHCYCGRGHDYGNGIKYPEKEEDRIAQALEWRKKGGQRPGFFPDGCSVSLLYPVVVDNSCMMNHYQEYVDEMFNRCEPY